MDTPTTGTFTNVNSKKTLYVNTKNYIEITSSYAKIVVDGNYYGINLDNANYHYSPYEEFGYMYIKKSTGEEAIISDGKLNYSDFIYDPVTQ